MSVPSISKDSMSRSNIKTPIKTLILVHTAVTGTLTGKKAWLAFGGLD